MPTASRVLVRRRRHARLGDLQQCHYSISSYAASISSSSRSRNSASSPAGGACIVLLRVSMRLADLLLQIGLVLPEAACAVHPATRGLLRPPPALRATPSAASGTRSASRCWSRRRRRRRAARAGALRAAPGPSACGRPRSPAWSTAARRAARRRRRARSGRDGPCDWISRYERSKASPSELNAGGKAEEVEMTWHCRAVAPTHHAPPHTYTVCRQVARASCNQLATLKDSPHPHSSLTFGFLNLKPSFRPSRV